MGIASETAQEVSSTNALNAALGSWGYVSLPNGGFDQNGNIPLPADFAVPEAWKEARGRISEIPLWSELIRILGVFTRSGTNYTCLRTAVSYRSDGEVRIVLVRSCDMASGSAASKNWSDNIWPMMLELQKYYAGGRYLIPRGLAQVITLGKSAVEGSNYWDKPAGSEPERPEPPLDPNDKKAKKKYEDALKVWETAKKIYDAKVNKAAWDKWRFTLATNLALKVLEGVANATTRSRLKLTVLWFDPKRGGLPGQQVRWSPLHQLYTRPNVRVVHYWWNYDWQSKRAYPFVYGAEVQRRGLGVTDVAHQPWELAARFYPLYMWPDLDLKRMEDLQKWQQQCRRVYDDVEERWKVVCPPPPALRTSVDVDDLGITEAATTSIVSATSRWDLSSGPGDVGLPDEGDVDAARADPDEPPRPPVEYVLESRTAVPVEVIAHSLPWDGGARIARGVWDSGGWQPHPDDDRYAPPLVWLPSLGIVAGFEGTDTWRPAGEVPQVVLSSELSSSTELDALESDTSDGPGGHKQA